MPRSGDFTFQVDENDSGQRLDLIVSARIPGCTRSCAANLIRQGRIHIQGQDSKPGYRVHAGDQIAVHIPPPERSALEPEPIDIEIIHEDEDLVVLNKQAGLVVHPAPGHKSGTLVNALLYHCEGLTGIGGELRPGIVHRLDKDTSGVLVVAKNQSTHLELSRQFKSRQVDKVYLALVHGRVEPDSGDIRLAVGRHPKARQKMSTKSPRGRSAQTAWQVKVYYPGVTLLALRLKTGRTHQIRVHCAEIGHPILGDSVYGGRKKRPKVSPKSDLVQAIQGVSRQMLHAWRLGFLHPRRQEFMQFEARLPGDMAGLIRRLERLAFNERHQATSLL